MVPCQGLLPWGPFVFSCLGRAAIFLACAGWVEAQVLAVLPRLVQFASFYGAVAYVVVSVVQLLQGSWTCSTPDMTVFTETGTVRKGSTPWIACHMRGWRPAQEDAHICRMLDALIFPDSALFAVLDGHGGGDVSKVISWLLVQEMEDIGRKWQQNHMKVSLSEVFRACLPRLDEKLNVGPYGLGRHLPAVMHPFLLMGSTGCIAAVNFSTREVITANIGDSRAMLIRGGIAIPLTEDHKPEDPEERRRILEAGGRVIKMGPCHRIDGSLNLSRAFGDFALKANKELPPGRQKVIAVPDLTTTPFQDGDLLLVGCDGLFERCTWQDVADIVTSRLQKGLDLAHAGQELLHACCATRPGEEGTDNETVVLVRLPASKAAVQV